jgi:hypothetical protein
MVSYSALQKSQSIILNNAKQSRGALDFLQQTNVEMFSKNEKSELLRLRGLLFEAQGDACLASVYALYSLSVQNNKTYAKTWLTWGIFLVNMFRNCRAEIHIIDAQAALRKIDSSSVEEEIKTPNLSAAELNWQSAISGTTSPPPSILSDKPEISNVRRDPASLVVSISSQAICAILTAVSLSCSVAVLQISRALWLISQLKEQPTLISLDPIIQQSAHQEILESFYNFAGEIPAWVWIHWIPQLLTGLSRPEKNVSQSLLISVLIAYPQQAYWPIYAAFTNASDDISLRNMLAMLSK